MMDSTLYTCAECGWEYEVAIHCDFDGRHGRADVELDKIVPCESIAVQKNNKDQE